MRITIHLSALDAKRLLSLAQSSNRELWQTLAKAGISSLKLEAGSGVKNPLNWFSSRPELIQIPEEIATATPFVTLRQGPIPHKIEIGSSSAAEPLSTEPQKALAYQKATELLKLILDEKSQRYSVQNRRLLLALDIAARQEHPGGLNSMAALLKATSSQASARQTVGALPKPSSTVAKLTPVEAHTTDFVDETRDPFGTNTGLLGAEQTVDATDQVQITERPDSQLTTLLETVCLSSEAQTQLQQVLEYIDSALSSDVTTEKRSSNAAILAFVRKCTGELARLSKLSIPEVGKALGEIAPVSLLSLPQLRWALKAGQIGQGFPAKGTLLQEKLDVAWELLSGFTLYTTALGLTAVLHEAIVKQTHVHELSSVRETSATALLSLTRSMMRLDQLARATILRAFTGSMPENLVSQQLATVQTNPQLRADSQMAFQISITLVHSEGELTWAECLRLANARARYHRFIDPADGKDKLEMAIEMEAQADGKVEISYSVVQQRLSPRHREYFERQSLAGRIQILADFVEYARQYHTSQIRIGLNEIERQMQARDQELFDRIRRKPPTS